MCTPAAVWLLPYGLHAMMREHFTSAPGGCSRIVGISGPVPRDPGAHPHLGERQHRGRRRRAACGGEHLQHPPPARLPDVRPPPQVLCHPGANRRFRLPRQPLISPYRVYLGYIIVFRNTAFRTRPEAGSPRNVPHRRGRAGGTYLRHLPPLLVPGRHNRGIHPQYRLRRRPAAHSVLSGPAENDRGWRRGPRNRPVAGAVRSPPWAGPGEPPLPGWGRGAASALADGHPGMEGGADPGMEGGADPVAGGASRSGPGDIRLHAHSRRPGPSGQLGQRRHVRGFQVDGERPGLPGLRLRRAGLQGCRASGELGPARLLPVQPAGHLRGPDRDRGATHPGDQVPGGVPAFRGRYHRLQHRLQHHRL